MIPENEPLIHTALPFALEDLTLSVVPEFLSGIA